MAGRRDKNADTNVERSLLGQRLLASLKKQEMMQPGDRVGVAVSGGADSVALLLLLLELREKLGIVLSVVHFNHKLRGKASDADQAFVAKLAAKHGLEFHSASVDVAKKAKKERANLEDAARRARYDYFRSLAESGACKRIVVAHTADDQAETVLAHLLRGTGLAGLGLVDRQVPAVVLAGVEPLDGRLRLGVGVHLDEPEPLRAVRVAIDDDLGALHRPEGREQRLQVGLVDVVGQVPHVQLLGQDQTPGR